MANEDIKISELPNGLVDEDSLFPTAQPDGLGDFSTAKISTTDIGNYVATEQQYSDLGGKTLVEAIGSAGGGGDLEDLDDVTITNPSDGDTIVYDATQQVWVNGQGSVVGDLDDLTDVDLSTPTNGQVLTYDATQQVWVNATPTTPASDLGDLDDVALTSEAEGEALAYDATNQEWVNKKIVKGMSQTDYDNLQTKDPNTLYVTDGTLPSGTVASNDVIAFSDVSDSNKPKSTVVGNIASCLKVEDISNVSLTTSDNNKLLGVRVSGSDISVVAVGSLFKVVNFDSGNLTVSAGATLYVSASDLGYSAPTGYTLSATLSIRTNNDNFYIRYFHPASYIVVRNTANSSQSVSVSATVLFIKSEYVDVV